MEYLIEIFPSWWKIHKEHRLITTYNNNDILSKILIYSIHENNYKYWYGNWH